MPKKTKQDGKYAQILVAVINKKIDPKNPPGSVEFDRSELDAAAEKLGHDIRNMPDAAYYLRSRAKALPQAIAKFGFSTLMSVGKGRFRLTKDVNDITLPAKIENRELDGNKIPKVVREIMLADEQSILCAMQYTSMLDDFLGAKCHRVLGHLRTTGPSKEQVEADEVYVAQKNGKTFVISIEAKGEKEKLGYSQMKATIKAVRKKFAEYPVIAIGIKQLKDGKILVLEFECTLKGDDVSQIKLKKVVRYSVHPTPTKWPQSEEASPLAE